MRLVATPIEGVHVVEVERHSDERGWFARTFDVDAFRGHGLELDVVQANTSHNARRGTLRGMHLQAEPHGEPKLVRCVQGAVWDVAVDLRAGSPTYGDWHAVELSAENARGFFLPPGIAHGFQTLTDDAVVEYLMGHRYVPEAATGVRWDDPRVGIDWPAVDGERIISDRDRALPLIAP